MAMFLSIWPSVSACQPKAPEDIPLDGRWQFAYSRDLASGAAGKVNPLPPPASSFAAEVQVPGYWDDQLDAMRGAPWWPSVYFAKPAVANGIPIMEGVGWYRRSIAVPESWRGRAVTLTVGGARTDCSCFVNGTKADFHAANLTPFECDLTEHLRYGQSNEIILAISNLPNVGGLQRLKGSSFSGYQGYSTGFFSGLNLHISGGPGRIESLFLHTARDLSTISWWVDLRGPRGPSNQLSRLRWQIRSLSGGLIKEGSVPLPASDSEGHYHAEWEVAFEGVKAWSTWDPQLYLTEVTWEDSQGNVWDRRIQRSGFRSLVSRDKSLFLNGRPIMLRGAHSAYYWPPNVNPPISVEFYRNLIHRLKEVGYNHIRFHTWFPPREFLEAADELGMLLQVEPSRPVDSQLGIEAWKEMIRGMRIHPSVVIYSGGNEQICTPELVGVLEQTYTEAKKLDPSGLVMPMETLRGIEYPDWVTKDLVAVPARENDPSTYHTRLFKRLAQSADVFGAYTWGELSYKNLMAADWRTVETRFAPYPRPVLAHEVGIIGGYLDLSLENRYTGRTPDTMYHQVRATLTAGNRLQMAPLYYQNSARWQSMARKYLLENARKCEAVKGYDNLGGWDMHWNLINYGSGTLNEFFELKYGDTAEKLQQYNGESVVLLDNQRRYRFRVGESFAAPVLVSLYGGRPLRQGTLHWKVSDGERLILQGDRKGLNAPDGHVTSLGELDFVWPALERARKLTLSVSVKDSGYNLTNQWDFWVFPNQQPPRFAAAADEECLKKLAVRYPGIVPFGSNLGMQARVVSALTAEHLHHLAAGGDVLLLGTEPFPASDTTFQIGIAGRQHMDLATVVNEHPVFAYLPHEGFCDWQFESLLEKGHTVIFSDKLPIPFHPILEIVGFDIEPIWKAAIWEVQTDGGRLFVASCHFDLDDPASVALLDGIIAYVTGPHFSPQVRVSTKELWSLLHPTPYPVWWEKVGSILSDP